MALNDSMDQAPQVATLADLLVRFRRQIELEFRASAPANVLLYNAATQTATVTLGALPVKYVEGLEVVQPPILIPEIPVEFLGTQFNYVDMPLAPGTSGMVTFTDRCLTLWLEHGIPTDPINGRTHNLADATFRPAPMGTTKTLPIPTHPVATTIEGPLIQFGALALLGPLAPQALLHGTDFVAALTTLAAAEGVLGAAQVVYTSAVATALTTWTNTGGPGGAPAANSVYIGATGAAYAVLGAAQVVRTAAWVTFIAAAPSWLSTKVFTE